jgi:hypothetical protein
MPSTLAAVRSSTRSTPQSDMLALLHEINAKLDVLLARQRRPLTRADRVILGRLLPAIAGALGSEPFVTRDLFDGEMPALRLVTRGLTPRQAGRLFGRAERRRQAIDGYIVQRDGSELHAALWRIVRAI